MTKTNDALVAYVKRALDEKWVYWYGTTGVRCTGDLLTRKTAQYPEHYTSNRMAAYQRHIAERCTCADCINLVKGFLWLDEATGKQKYASNGCPDKSADGMFALAKEKGGMASLPEIPGLIVRFPGHAGVYIGMGQVIEARGFSFGVVQTRLKERPWTHWYKMPGITYAQGKIEDSVSTAPDGNALAFTRLLRRGCTGEDVKRLQERLLELGYALPRWGADGEFGAETDAAVRALQRDAKIGVDGVVGPVTVKALGRDAPAGACCAC